MYVVGQGSTIEILHLTTHLTLHVAIPYRIALVMRLFSPTEGNAHLHQISLEIHQGGNKGHSLLIDLPLHSLHLLAMYQKTSFPFRFMVVDTAMGVGGDVETDEHKTFGSDLHIAVAEGESSHPDRFHFCSLQRYAAFKILHHFIVEVGLLVLLQYLDFVFSHTIFPLP